ncbi:DUF6504 family protein [Kribbella sp. HUAS MG21]|uniref:DUF6504 family protein n=1 Tax=Kribbella sp. HUAS MG21 TaxID=3160966 RepID=A0AAU7TC44_9ACTN
MWEFDDAVEVHSVSVDGVQTPDQFLWRGRLWRVRSVTSHWTETAAWWERGVIGTGHTHDPRATHRHADPSEANRTVLAADARTDVRTDAHAERRVAVDSLARIDAATVAEVCSAARGPRPTRSNRAGVAAAANPRSRPAATLPSLSHATPAAVGVLDAEWGPERAVFRVEAGCGRYGRQEMFDLAHDPASGRWQLERVTDR